MNVKDIAVNYWIYSFDNYKSPIYIREIKDKKNKTTYYKDESYKSRSKKDNNSKGSFIKQITLGELVDIIKNTERGPKGSSGSYFFYNDIDSLNERRSIDLIRSLSEEEQSRYTSADFCAVDVDGIGEEVVRDILGHWNQLIQRMPSLMLGYISSSCRGLHALVRIDPVGYNKYPLITAKANTRFAEVVKEVCGVDINDKLDETATNITQQQFISYSDVVCFNEDAVSEEYNVEITNDKLKKKTIVRKVSAQDTVINAIKGDQRYVIINRQDVEVSEHIGWRARYSIWNTLAHIYDPNSDEFKQEWHHCCQLMPEDDHNQDYYEFEDPIFHKYTIQDKYISISKLKKLGYNIITKDAAEQQARVEEEVLSTEDKIKKEVERRRNERWRCNDVEALEVNTYLSNQYESRILDEINLHSSVCIKGCTGIGKTVAIAKIAKQVKGIVAVPFIAVRGNYTSQGLEEVLDRKSYTGQACCMTFDRLSMLYDTQLQDKYIFIDESHVMFRDRDYRKNLIYAQEKLNRCGCKVIYVSATPLQESERVEKKLIFWKERSYVDTYVAKCKNVGNYLNRMIDSGVWRKNYNRVLMFSDRYARTIKDNHMYLTSELFSILHSDYTWTGDLDRVKESQSLDSDVTVATSLAFNGLNFINEGEKILVVSAIDSTSTAWEVIQQVGRIRNSVVDLLIVCPDDKDSEQARKDSEYQAQKAKLYISLDDSIYHSNSDLLNEEIYNANREIDEYVETHSGLRNILSDLLKEGYFRMKEGFEDDVKGRVNNNQRRQADKLCRETYSSGRVNGLEGQLQKYYDEIVGELDSFILLSNVDSSVVDRLLKEVMSKTLLSIIGDLKQVLSINSYSDVEWEKLNKRVDETISRANVDNRILARDIANDRTKANDIREEYSDYNNSNDIVNHYIDLKVEMMNSANESRREYMSTSYTLTNSDSGEVLEFNSRRDLTSYIGCSPNIVDKIIKGTSKKYKHLTIQKV